VLFPNVEGVTHGADKAAAGGSSEAPQTGKGQVERQPNTLPNSKHVPVTGKGLTVSAFVSSSSSSRSRTSSWSKAITGAANNGSGLIRITAVAHTFRTGDRITITGVGGTTEANAANWPITVITVDTFDLQGSTFTNAYTSGGTAKRTQG
jgi:hypothetical protein